MTRFAALACTLACACYDPEAVDCTVSCSEPQQCAAGQVCGSDGFCAAPEVAGQCSELGESESTLVTLEVSISGDGVVYVQGMGECDTRTAFEGRCTFSVPPSVERTLRAVAAHDDELKSWSGACEGGNDTCELVPVSALTRVGAKFE